MIVLAATVVAARRTLNREEEPLVWLTILTVASLRSPFLSPYAVIPALFLTLLRPPLRLRSGFCAACFWLGLCSMLRYHSRARIQTDLDDYPAAPDCHRHPYRACVAESADSSDHAPASLGLATPSLKGQEFGFRAKTPRAEAMLNPYRQTCLWTFVATAGCALLMFLSSMSATPC